MNESTERTHDLQGREIPKAKFVQLCAATSCDVVTDRPWAQLFALDEHGKIWKYTNTGMIRIASFVLWLALSAPAFATPVYLDFTGAMTSGSGVGSFQYDTSATPTLTNVGGMQNFVYTPTSWVFLITSTFIPSQTFWDQAPNQTGSLCVGICTFGSGQQVRLNLSDGAGLSFHFAFDITQPLTQLPTFNQIGGYSQAVYDLNDGNDGRRVAVFQTGALTQSVTAIQGTTQSVPEPSSNWLFFSGCAVIWGVLYWKEVTRR